jgi:hypothetical protein
MKRKFNSCGLPLLLFMASAGLFSISAEAQDTGTMPSSTNGAPAASQPSGLVFDPAEALAPRPTIANVLIRPIPMGRTV